MPIPINAPPESLAHYLTTTLWRERATLRLLVRRKAREPSIDYLKARANRTAREACHERVGVCRDFAHLAIALCRCMNIPRAM